MRDFIDIIAESAANGPIDIHEQAHDLAMSAIYNAKANKQLHGHSDVFWWVDLNKDLSPPEMVKVIDLTAIGQIAIKSAKNWLHRSEAITILPFHDPNSERHVIEKLTNAIILKNTPVTENVEEECIDEGVEDDCDGKGCEDDKPEEKCEGEKCEESASPIRAMLEKALAGK